MIKLNSLLSLSQNILQNKQKPFNEMLKNTNEKIWILLKIIKTSVTLFAVKYEWYKKIIKFHLISQT